MSHLSPRERELVALGAALGSNCIPCIEHHIPASRKAGLTDSQISEAIRLADAVRRVPARKVFEAALQLVSEPADTLRAGSEQSCQASHAELAADSAHANADQSVSAARSARSDRPCCG